MADDRLRDAVDTMARAMAAMYYFIASEVVGEFGDRGKAALERGVRRFGEYRGKRIRERVEKAGAEPSMATFRQFYDMPLGAAWRTRRSDTQDGQVSEIDYCPMAAEWQELGGSDLGMGYCVVDYAIAEGFDKDMVFRRESSIPGGQKCCRHVVTYRK